MQIGNENIRIPFIFCRRFAPMHCPSRSLDYCSFVVSPRCNASATGRQFSIVPINRNAPPKSFDILSSRLGGCSEGVPVNAYRFVHALVTINKLAYAFRTYADPSHKSASSDRCVDDRNVLRQLGLENAVEVFASPNGTQREAIRQLREDANFIGVLELRPGCHCPLL